MHFKIWMIVAVALLKRAGFKIVAEKPCMNLLMNLVFPLNVFAKLNKKQCKK